MATNNKGKGSKTTTTRSRSTSSTSKPKSSATKSASTRSSGTRTRTATGKRTTKNSRSNAQNSELNQEIITLLILGLAIIFLLSNFGLAGIVGDGIQYFMFGLFGVVEYALPLILGFLILLILFNKNVSVARIKSIAILGVIILLSGICSLIINQPEVATASIGEHFSVSASEKTGGGLFGGLLTWMFSPIGKVGTYVILIVLLIICLIIITERSFIGGVRNSGSRIYNATKNDYENFKEQNAVKRQIHEERRKERQEERLRRQEEERKNALENKKGHQHEVDEYIGVDGPNPSMAATPELGSDDNPEIIASKPVKNRKAKKGEADSTEPKKPIMAEVTTTTPELPPEKEEPSIFDQIDLTKNGEASRSRNKAKGITEDVTIPRTGANPDLHEVNVGISRIDSFANDIYSPAGDMVETTARTVAVTESAVKTATPKRVSEVKQTAVHEIKATTLAEAEKPAVEENVVGMETVKSSEADVNNIAAAVITKPEPPAHKYQFPPIDLLDKGTTAVSGDQKAINDDLAIKLKQTLLSFGVKADIDNITCGPSVTRFELKPEQGVKVSKIVSLSDDIKLALAATDIRIEAPVPGKSTVGIEVPNKVSTGVKIRDLVESDIFKKHPSNIVFAVGKDIAGQIVLGDIAKMPHVLIAGQTGSGKSVCINTIIMSILYRAKPEDVKFIMVDPKVVELSVYNGIPHLMIPVVTDPKKAAAALNWAVAEMTDRYKKFAEKNVRDLKGYNEKLSEEVDENGNKPAKLPQIVIIVDELADLMMTCAGEVEDAIQRLAQLARAAGIHLVVATQRPTVNVITGTIKANIPSRIAFSVAQGNDSRTIIDTVGAEKLLGRGDMLYLPAGSPKPTRVQGAFVDDKEVSRVVDFFKENAGETDYSAAIESQITSTVTMSDSAAFGDDRDALFADAGRFIIEKEKGSIGMLQRYFKIGFNRAARIMDQLADANVVGPEEGTKPRKILMTLAEFEEFIKQ